MVQRLVLIGWADDARDLLYVHTDTPAQEDRHSMQAEVSSKQPAQRGCALIYTGCSD